MSAIDLYKNRKWYFQLMGKVGQAHSPEQRQLLLTIREMVEGGVVFDKHTVKDLVALFVEQGGGSPGAPQVGDFRFFSVLVVFTPEVLVFLEMRDVLGITRTSWTSRQYMRVVKVVPGSKRL